MVSDKNASSNVVDEPQFIYNCIYLMLGIYLTYNAYVRFIMVPLLHRVMVSIHDKIEELKKNLFRDAIKSIKSLSASETKEQKPIVLEIGVGAGENFRFFPENSEVHILDKTDMFLPFLKEAFKVRPDLKIEKLIVEKAENMISVESNSIDLIVHTFILCSVDNQKMVLNEIYRVLKPGGVCVFIEHSICTQKGFTRFIQKMIGPLWFACFDCRFKDIKEIFNDSKYETISFEQHNIKSWLLFLVNPIFYGYGIKK